MGLTKRNIGIYIVVLLAWWSCNKIDVPEPVEEEPIFFSDLQAGDENLDFSAGRDNYLMEANFRIDPNNHVLDLVGILRPADCNSRLCSGSIRISLRHNGPYDRTAFNIDDVFSDLTRDYAWSINRDSARAVFIPKLSQDAITKVSWTFSDLKEVHNKKEIQRVLNVNQDYLLTLEVGQRSCLSSQTQTINLTTGGCKSVIGITNRRVGVRNSGHAPYKYQWSNGSTDSTVQVSAISATDMRTFAVTVTDRNGCVSSASLGMSPGVANDASCFTDFAYSHRFLENEDKLQYGTALIEVVNRDGMILRSDRFKQPADASFRILEVSDFENTDRGFRTKKLKISITSLLANNTNTQEVIKLNGNVVIAVAYPD
ncbi:MAG: hypothetical protein HKN76_08775 [Saprospiraceae bacterium]|nr:hypothetical protein [Saprospiraceae bacterium]